MEPLIRLERNRKKAVKQLSEFIALRCDAELIYKKYMDRLSTTNITEFSDEYFCTDLNNE